MLGNLLALLFLPKLVKKSLLFAPRFRLLSIIPKLLLGKNRGECDKFWRKECFCKAAIGTT